MKTLLMTEEELRQILHSERQAVIKEISQLFKPGFTDKKLSAIEAASFLGISISTLYKRVKEIPHTKFGKKLIFSSSKLNQFVGSHN